MTSEPVTAELEEMLVRLTHTIESAAERIAQSADTGHPADEVGMANEVPHPSRQSDDGKNIGSGRSKRANDEVPANDESGNRSQRMARLIGLQQMYRQLQRGGVDDRSGLRDGRGDFASRSAAHAASANASARDDRLMPVVQALLKVNQEMLAELRRAANQPSPGAFA